MAVDLAAQQFSQPMLPGMNVKPTDEHRWPRGYTPERMAEVQGKLKSENVSVVDRGGLQAPLKNHGYGASNYNAQTQKFSRRVVDTISRSTIPVEHLEGLRRIEQHQTAQMVVNAAGTYESHGLDSSKPTTAERYQGAGPTVKINAWSHLQSGQRVPLPGGEDIKVTPVEHTLVHEIGHHAHYMGAVGPEGEWDDRKENGSRPGPDPVLEGRAEAYGREHWRQDPREARKNPQEYKANYDVLNGAWAFHDDQTKFNNIYHGQPDRPAPKPAPSPGQVGTYPSGRNKYVGDPDVEGQDRLFMRHKPFDAEQEALPDYGQYPLYRNVPKEDWGSTEEPISTIRTGRGAIGGLSSKQFK